MGLDLDPLLASGNSPELTRPPTETQIDVIGSQLLSLIRERKVRRLFVDGFDALDRAMSTHRGSQLHQRASQ